ncbi:PspA/IM30 family protein [Flammeovirga pacifica]|uniref:Phage shock protein A n=1 Tax=Flammeovirga pacifica TaxID=915059 RepID=A0A1S1YXX5_FLAPC|nr:PspA/IM30 family protein [Flammeovirga pacifica]OHX65840.1 phage shock protein A [Flammeovirga pacifica]
MFKRLFGWMSSEANSAMDKLEDPIKMTDQGIRDLKKDLDSSLQGLAQVKAIAIRTRKEYEQQKQASKDWERKAIMLLQKGQAGQIDPAEADRLATEALNKKEQAAQSVASHEKMVQTNDAQVAKMEQNVQKLKSQISQWENEAKTLKARAKVSEASSKINKQLASIDSSSTMAMLERMKDKVEAQEALAESYGDIADANVTVDDEINKALGPGSGSSSLALEELKEKMRLGDGSSQQNTTQGNADNTDAGELSELDKLKQQLKKDE